MNKTERGRVAETRAQQFLEQAGLRFIARNVHSRTGELDLIMTDGNTVVFVEVRSRKRSRFGNAASSINLHKQRRLLASSQLYLQRRQWSHRPARIDVIAIDLPDSLQPGDNQQQISAEHISWLRGAISSDSLADFQDG